MYAFVLVSEKLDYSNKAGSLTAERMSVLILFYCYRHSLFLVW